MARGSSKQGSPVLFDPTTWAFWRNNIMCFCINNVLGHCLESLYCKVMDRCFGLIDDSYAVKFDPWYHPYWVYGIGGEVMTLIFEPIKERILGRHRSLPGATLETYAIAVLAAMGMELGFGLLVNRPDEDGNYPYWDNSELPLNVFKQAWLVNDLVIGAVAVVHVWLAYPLLCKVMARLGERAANAVFAATVGAFAAACVSSYTRLIKDGRLWRDIGQMREARNDTGGEGSGREGRNGRLAMVSAACAGLIVTAMLAVLGGKVEVNLPKK